MIISSWWQLTSCSINYLGALVSDIRVWVLLCPKFSYNLLTTPWCHFPAVLKNRIYTILTFMTPHHKKNCDSLFFFFHLKKHFISSKTMPLKCGCSIAILWSKIDLNFFSFSLFFPYKWTNILKCIQPTGALFWCDWSHFCAGQYDPNWVLVDLLKCLILPTSVATIYPASSVKLQYSYLTLTFFCKAVVCRPCLLRRASVIAHHHTHKMILRAIFSTPKSG